MTAACSGVIEKKIRRLRYGGIFYASFCFSISSMEKCGFCTTARPKYALPAEKFLIAVLDQIALYYHVKNVVFNDHLLEYANLDLCVKFLFIHSLGIGYIKLP